MSQLPRLVKRQTLHGPCNDTFRDSRAIFYCSDCGATVNRHYEDCSFTGTDAYDCIFEQDKVTAYTSYNELSGWIFW